MVLPPTLHVLRVARDPTLPFPLLLRPSFWPDDRISGGFACAYKFPGSLEQTPRLCGFGSTAQLLELDWYLQRESSRLAVPYISFYIYILI